MMLSHELTTDFEFPVFRNNIFEYAPSKSRKECRFESMKGRKVFYSYCARRAHNFSTLGSKKSSLPAHVV